MEGFMTPRQAEDCIWSFYWQLDNSRDRRIAPLVTEPEGLSEEDLARIRDEQTPFWRKQQLKLLEVAERRGGVLAPAARRIRGIFTTEAEQRYAMEAALAEEREKWENKSQVGKVDPKTGLPISAADLETGRNMVAGEDLCMEAIIPPRDLAEAFTTWLPPCPPDADEATWGEDLSHWQSLGYKPKNKPCSTCGGSGREFKELKFKKGGLKNVLFRREAEEIKRISRPCEDCEGRGSVGNWDPEEHRAVEHNATLIAEAVHRLESEGFFDLRPISSHDREMGDLVWEDRAGHTIGFRLNRAGYQRMKEFAQSNEHIQHRLHVLELAGHDVRASAPEWAKKEYSERSASFGGAALGGGAVEGVAGSFD